MNQVIVRVTHGRSRGMTKIEDLTNEQLDVLVAEKVKGWKIIRFEDGLIIAQTESGELKDEKILAQVEWKKSVTRLWSPSTDVACAFQVDRPEWAWQHWEYISDELGPSLMVQIKNSRKRYLATVIVTLDPTNKTAAYCRGRCIAALKACGVTAVGDD